MTLIVLTRPVPNDKTTCRKWMQKTDGYAHMTSCFSRPALLKKRNIASQPLVEITLLITSYLAPFRIQGLVESLESPTSTFRISDYLVMRATNIQRLILKATPSSTDYFDQPYPKEPNFQPSDLATSEEINDNQVIFSPTIVSDKTIDTLRDWSTSSNFGSAPGDPRGDMSDSSIPRHVKPRHSRTHHNNPQRRPTQQPSTSHAHSLPQSPQVSFENTQHHLPTNFSIPSLHYPTSPQPHGHGGTYIGPYTMSPQPSPMGAVHSPPSYPFSHTYHHPIVPESNIIPQNLHTHYQSLSQHPHAGSVYQYQHHSQEGNSPLHSSFPRTGPYPAHQANALGPTSPHPTLPTAQNSSLSPSYIGSGVFHTLQYPSPMSTPHYTYSPPFPGTPSYQSQYPPQFGQRYTANREGEPHGDWYYVPRPSPVAPSQQYDSGPSYSGRYPPTYPQIRPDVNDAYTANSFPSANSSAPYPIVPFSRHSETLSSEIFRSSATHTASLSPGSEHPPSDRHVVRQPYHPNPPPHRSEWVMWAGNIPSDASHDEIYRFFSQVSEDRASDPTASMGVVSVFLISRSNCAFLNFETEDCLLEAISRFNGVPLRSDDARCARLVCRVRRKDDDLKAGVGGQRGTGMHTRWVKEQKQRAQEKAVQQPDLSVSDHSSMSTPSVSEQLANRISNLSVSSDDSELGQSHDAKLSSTADSYSSSNSSFLARHFPKRYFILKSLTQHDLDLSVQTGFWATQKHNEGILDQSYRTSKDVFLIFGANKSGEFYGYARMAGPVRRGGQNIHWAPSPPRSNQSPSSGRLSSECPTFFSPGDNRLVDSSPLSLDTHTKTGPQSAPSMFGLKYDLLSMRTPETKHSLDQQQAQCRMPNLTTAQKDHDFELDPSAPVRAMRSSGGKSGPKSKGTSLHSLEKVEENVEEHGDNVPDIRTSHKQEGKGEEAWGDCFAVEWISVEKLPFNRTRQLRNPWNHDREVKVSRDGTELEPTIGQKLLDEWHKLSDPQQEPSTFEGGVNTQAGGSPKPAESSSKRPASSLTATEHRSGTRGSKEGEKAG